MTRTILDRVPKSGGVLLGEAHDLFGVAVAHEVCLFSRAGPAIGSASASPSREPLNWTCPGTTWSGPSSIIPSGDGRRPCTHLLDAVEKRVPNIPFVTFPDLQPPWQLRLVKIDEQADGQVPHLDLLVVEAAAGGPKKGGQSRQELCQVAEAGDRGDEGGAGRRLARDAKGHSQAPEGLRDARVRLGRLLAGNRRQWRG